VNRSIVIVTLSILFVIGWVHASYGSTISLYCADGVCHTSGITAIKKANIVKTQSIHKIGIQLSQSCITLEKNHIKSNCLTYDKLKQFDNSNSLLGGVWVNDTWYHRLNAHVKNAYQFYNLKEYLVMVDPDSSFTTGSKMIIVQSNNFAFMNPFQTVGSNHTATSTNNRYVSNCAEAQVISNIDLIKDTIAYLENNCTSTQYNTTKIIQTPYFAFDLHSTMIKSLSWLHQFKNTTKFTQDCRYVKCDFKDPNSGYRW